VGVGGHEAPVAHPCIALILGVCQHCSHHVVAAIAMLPSGFDNKPFSHCRTCHFAIVITSLLSNPSLGLGSQLSLNSFGCA